MWRVAHPIWEKRSRRCRPSLPSFNGVGGARKRTKSSVKSSCSWLISGSGAGSTPAGSGLPPTSSSVGCAGFVTLISAANAPALNSRSVGTKDRKSTRLNSSHSQISYAVFCLKKKKKQNKHYRETKRTNNNYTSRQ